MYDLFEKLYETLLSGVSLCIIVVLCCFEVYASTQSDFDVMQLHNIISQHSSAHSITLFYLTLPV